MRTSVLLCTYNGAKYLEPMLDSLLGQTLSPGEVVVCDDGSTDDTLSLLKAFTAKAAFPVRIIQNTHNLGFAENFLNGIGLTEGEIIFFCDQDDIWYSDKLERCCSAMKQSGALLLAHGFVCIDGDGRPLSAAPESCYEHAAIPVVFGAVMQQGFSLAMNRQLIQYAALSLAPDTYRRCCESYAKSGLAHDQIICLVASSLGVSASISLPLAAYRIHGENITQDLSLYINERGGALRRALSRWHDRRQAGAVYAELSEDLTRQVAMLRTMREELMNGGHTVREIDNYIQVVSRRQKDNRLRSKLYSSQSAGLAGFVEMIRAGCYRRCDAGLGRANAFKDLLVALFPPREC